MPALRRHPRLVILLAALGAGVVLSALPASRPGRAAPPVGGGGQARAVRSGVVNVLSFGTVKGDGVTDDAPALQTIINNHPGRTIYLPTTPADPAAGGVLNASYYLASVPAGNYAGACLDLQTGSTTLAGDGTRTVVKVKAGLSGVRMSGGNNVVRDLYVWGSEGFTGANGGRWWEFRVPANRYTPPGWSRTLNTQDGVSGADGIQIASGNAVIENVWCTDFGRSGINSSEGDNGSLENERPAVRDSTLNNNCGEGIIIQGRDSNVFNLVGLNVNNNTLWGIDNEAFLGGTVRGAQADNNGYDASPYVGVAFAPVLSITRTGHAVTLTFLGVYPDPAFATFAPGTAVEVAACGDPSFVGRWRVGGASVAGGNTTVTYTQLGTMAGADAADAAPAPAVRVAGTTTASSVLVTGLTSTAGIAPGMYVFGPNVVAPTNAFGPPPRVQSVDSPTRLTLDTGTPTALAGTATLTFTTCYAAYNLLPGDGTIAAAVRAGGVVTLTCTGAYTVSGATGGIGPVALKPGHGVQVQNASDPSFNGTFVITGTGVDGSGRTTLTYSQAAPGALPDATATSGTARLAVPRDTILAAGLNTGCYRSKGGGNVSVWDGCYSEGSQHWDFDSSGLVIQPVRSDPIPGSLAFSSFVGGIAGPGSNLPFNLAMETDGDAVSERRVGLRVTGSEVVKWTSLERVRADNQDPTITNWRTKVHPNEWSLYNGDPQRDPAAHVLEYYTRKGETYYGSSPGYPIYLNHFPGLGVGVVVGDGTGELPGGTGRKTAIVGGSIAPTPIPDAAAPVGAFFLGSDHPDGAGNPQLCLKWAAGVKVIPGL